MEEVIDHQKLRELRRRAGLTLKQVEDLTGISASTLCNFERGRLLLPWPRLKKLLQLYRIDLLELQELLCL
jgi:transcriptional regulator with XRE-family HTH domain